MTTEHLTPDAWAVANRALVRKALAEFIHERILEPVAIDNGYELSSGTSRYTFTARLYPLNHWDVDADIIRATVTGLVDALDFITEFHEQLGIGADDAAGVPRGDQQHARQCGVQALQAAI